MKLNFKHILIIAATPFEIAPLTDFLQSNWQTIDANSFSNNETQIDIIVAGIGLLATSFHLSQQLQSKKYDFVLQLGIAGVYPNKGIQLTDLVWIKADQVADLGAIDKQGTFVSTATMGLSAPTAVSMASPEVSKKWKPYFETLISANGLSVNCILGDPNWFLHFGFSENNVVVESMEGAALHYTCSQSGVEYAQVRAISNWIEPRDKSRWQIQEAILKLNQWAIGFVKHL